LLRQAVSHGKLACDGCFMATMVEPGFGEYHLSVLDEEHEMPTTSMIPVTLITGFLGAGKTTLLNRILTERHGEKIAVIENEFGEIGIDNDLLVQGEEQIVEMNNGCICCTVRGDLVRILGDLATKRDSGALKFDRIIIETTGLADPGPVAQTFFVDENIAERYLLDAVVTVVDARHGKKQLDDHETAQEQVGFADRILISKSDLVAPQELALLRQRLVHMNPRASIHSVHFGEAPLNEILDVRAFDFKAILDIEPGFLEEDHHEHDDTISSFVFKSDREFDGDRLADILGALVNVYGNDLLRYKGILAIAGRSHRVVFQGVHMLMGGTPGNDWGSGEQRQSVMVFIGRNLPKEVIEDGLKNALVKGRKAA